MSTQETVPIAVRPGEHACCRFLRAEDRRGFAASFVRDALRRGSKVVYLCQSEDIDALEEVLRASGEEVGPAIERGQLELAPMVVISTPEGELDIGTMLLSIIEQRDRALDEGYPALSMTGDMSWALQAPSHHAQLPEYERRVAEVVEQGDFAGLCQYDHGQFDRATISDVAAAHPVDLAPELAALLRTGSLAGARIDGRILRLAGELDFASAEALTSVLHAHFHGPLEVDLRDLDFVDVAGMRALRRRTGQPLTITMASSSVQRLAGLLGWDTDPHVEMVT